MNFECTSVADVVIVKPRRFTDSRGYFIETYKHQAFMDIVGENVKFVQDNFSFSELRGTVRGLHFQSPPKAQGKLVRCTRGALLDVAVDIRVGSPSYMKSVAIELTPDNDKQLWVPPGFLHGFLTLAPDTEISYKCTDYYAPEEDGSIAWNDPDLGIDWGISPDIALLSDKDKNAQSFSEFNNPFKYKG